MLKPHFGFQSVEYGLDGEALAQHDRVGQRHEIVPHVAPDAGDEVKAPLPEFAEEVPADVALVGVEGAGQGWVIASSTVLSAVLPGVIFSAMTWPLWLITK